MTRIRHAIEALLFSLLLATSRLVPRRLLLALGSLIGTLAFHLHARRRRVALDNLRLAYGAALSRPQARRIVLGCFRHFARITLDSIATLGMDESAVRAIVRHEGLEHVRQAYARGRGVLLFSGHYGHWELTALVQGWLGLPLALITRPLDNPFLEHRLAALRSRSGNRVVHRQNAVREMLRALRGRLGVAIVIDQDARRGGIFVPFFGHPASTTPTLATVALRTGAAIVPTFSVPEPGGRYRIVYEPEVLVAPTGDRAADVERLTAVCTEIIESWIRRNPELWLWFHRRWKTRPPPAGANCYTPPA